MVYRVFQVILIKLAFIQTSQKNSTLQKILLTLTVFIAFHWLKFEELCEKKQKSYQEIINNKN